MKPINFLCPFKQKLDEFRNGHISLDEMLDFIYSIDKNFKKKVVRLQKDFKANRDKEYWRVVGKWKKQN